MSNEPNPWAISQGLYFKFSDKFDKGGWDLLTSVQQQVNLPLRMRLVADLLRELSYLHSLGGRSSWDWDGEIGFGVRAAIHNWRVRRQ